jgi:cell pole-organizing protein PopZ
VTSEPDMENLLASIRKAIDSDIGQNTKPQSFASAPLTPLKGTTRELRMKFENDLAKSKASSEDILELRNRINRNRTADAIVEPLQRHPPAAPAASSRSGFAAILAGDLAARGTSPRAEPVAEPPYLRPTLQESEPPVQNYQAPEDFDAQAAWGAEEQSYLPVVHDGYGDYAPEPLMSDQPALAANESFSQLADTLMARALGERSIEDMTQDLLRGMLRNWLDAHLPSLVERLVREEIERVARRGR